MLAAMLVMGVVGALLPAPWPGGALPQAAAAGVAGDPEVRQAQQALDEARRRLEATTRELDQLAATFETARGHAERLASELDGADSRIDRAEQAVAEARAAAAREVRAAYMLPGVDLLRVSGAFLLAPDVGTALHASAMMQQVARNRAARAAAASRQGREVAEDVHTQQTIAGGTAAALRDVESLTATFTSALDAAVAEVAGAEHALADARAAAEQRAQAQLAQGVVVGPLVGAVGAPPIRIATLNGGTQEMTCPLGQPNGFIDSWGFPRSGGRTHKGVDMFAAYGMPVFAAADGTIRRVFNNRLGGLSVDLIDQLGNRYYYAHLSATYVTSGQPVQVGQLIAANGNSGNAIATPPHLHWQFHPGDGAPVNPFPLAAALCR